MLVDQADPAPSGAHAAVRSVMLTLTCSLELDWQLE